MPLSEVGNGKYANGTCEQHCHSDNAFHHLKVLQLIFVIVIACCSDKSVSRLTMTCTQEP